MSIPGGVVDVGAKLNPNKPGGASTWTITVDDAALSVAVAVSSSRRRTLAWVLTTAAAEIRADVVAVVVEETGASIGFVFDDDACSIIDLFVILLTYFVLYY